MSFLKKLLWSLVGLVIAFLAVGMILPREVAVSRNVEINALAEKIFPLMNSPKAMEAWSPWLSIDPDVKVSYNDIVEGKGASMTWESDHEQVGSGSAEIIESVENEKIMTALDFGDHGTATASMMLAEEGGKTDVTWGFVADMGAGPIGRWMGLMMDSWVGGDYQRGLNNLKELVESQ